MAAIAASALLAIAIHPLLGLLYLASYGAPTAWVAHLVGLSRPSEENPEQRDWFPLDTVLLRASLAAAVSIVIWMALRGVDTATLTAGLLDAMTAMMTGGDSSITREEIEPVVQAVVAMMPLLFAFSALFMLVLNLYVGARITQKSGLLQRPWIPLWTVRVQRVVVGFFVLTLAASFFGGTIGTVGGAFAGAFAAAFALTGYGYAHAALQNRPARGPLLWLLYLLSFLFSPTLAVMCLLGLADSLFDLRSRRHGGQAGPS
jgi:hypothetical protein